MRIRFKPNQTNGICRAESAVSTSEHCVNLWTLLLFGAGCGGYVEMVRAKPYISCQLYKMPWELGMVWCPTCVM